MKVPNSENAFVDIAKLTGYCLNKKHPIGKHKARLFESILGISTQNAKELKEILLQEVNKNACNLIKENEFGKYYSVDFLLETKKNQAKIRSSWIIKKDENFPRLVSCYILKLG